MIDHTADGIAMLIGKLAKYGDPTDVHIGIERPNGRLVDLLLQAGHPVIPVSPNAISPIPASTKGCTIVLSSKT